jgi:hypothetical protein
MANHKTELQFYVECIEEKLETFSSQQRFSLAYCARTKKISTFIELVFADQGFQILSIDCDKLYGDSNVAKLAETIAHLKTQCIELDKPAIIFHNAHTLSHNEDDHNLLLSVLRDGFLVEKEPENDFIPVILTSTRTFNSTYSDHLNQVLNFNHMMVEKNQRVKKIWDAIETDELLAALQDDFVALPDSIEKYPVIKGAPFTGKSSFSEALKKKIFDTKPAILIDDYIPPTPELVKYDMEKSHFSDKTFSIMDTSGSMSLEEKEEYSPTHNPYEKFSKHEKPSKFAMILSDDIDFKKAADMLLKPVGFQAVEEKIQKMKNQQYNSYDNDQTDITDTHSVKNKP